MNLKEKISLLFLKYGTKQVDTSKLFFVMFFFIALLLLIYILLSMKEHS